MSNGNNIAHSFKFFTLSLNPYQLLHSFVVIFWYIEEKKCVFGLTSALVLTWCNLLYSSYYQCIKLGSFWTSKKFQSQLPKNRYFRFWNMFQLLSYEHHDLILWCKLSDKNYLYLPHIGYLYVSLHKIAHTWLQQH